MISFQPERQYLGCELGRVEIDGLQSVRAIKLTRHTLLFKIPVISTVVIALFFGDFELKQDFLISRPSLNKAKIIRQIDSFKSSKDHIQRLLAATRLDILQHKRLPKGIYRHDHYCLIPGKNGSELILSTKSLGSGGFKQVKKAYNLATGQKIALSILKNPSFWTRMFTKREYYYYSQLKKHRIENTVGFDSIHYDQSKNIIGLMPYCKDGHLGKLLPTLTYEQKRNAFKEIAYTIAQIHKIGLVHRDIKPENFLVHNNRILLADFGLTASVKEIKPKAGTVAYMPPESYVKITPRQDAWAFGVMLYLAFRDARHFDSFIYDRRNGLRPSALERLKVKDERIAKVIDGLLEPDPQKRLSLHQAHQLLKD